MARQPDRRSTLMFAFRDRGEAVAALEELLDAGFLNVAEEIDGGETVLIVDTGGKPEDARRVAVRHHGIELSD